LGLEGSIYYVVGLGNPGSKYSGTRHNVGFDFVDLLCNELGGNWLEDKKAKYFIANISLPKGRILRLVKPNSFMNLSGEQLLSVIKFYKDFSEAEIKNSSKESPLNILVVQDELDFKPGDLKYKLGGSAGGHKGVQSIINILGTPWFPRYRIGVGHPRMLIPEGHTNMVEDVSSWVLSKPNEEDRKQIGDVVRKVVFNFKSRILLDDDRNEFFKF